MNKIGTIPFSKWIRQDRENRWMILVAAVYTIGVFAWLKIRYPYPNFIPDSYSYIEAAIKNKTINMWPIGYSKFLRLFSCFSRSNLALVFVQYALLQSCSMYFLLSVRYVLSPGKWIFRIVFAGVILNPLTPYLCNFVTSDALFASLSLVWVAQIIWIIYQPVLRLFLWHAFILLMAFSVRYNSIFYPFLSIAVIICSQAALKLKVIGLAALVMFTGGFITFNCWEYKNEVGTAQFSGFGGWQLASNALYAYAHSPKDKPENLPLNMRKLQIITNRHMDSLNHLIRRPDMEPGIYYLWDEKAPLKLYMNAKWENDTVTDGFNKWASMAPLYGNYGMWMIRNHPTEYLKYYIWPNLQNYYSPGAEFLASYNMGFDSVGELAKYWFDLPNRMVPTKPKKVPLAHFYPTILAIVNPLFIILYLAFLFSLMRIHRKTSLFISVLNWVAIIWFANLAFSVLASPIVLRYQTFPAIVTAVFLVVLVEDTFKDKIAVNEAALKSNNFFES